MIKINHIHSIGFLVLKNCGLPDLDSFYLTIIFFNKHFQVKASLFMISKRFYKRDRFKVRDDDSKPLIGGHVEIGGSFLSRCLDPRCLL